MVATKQKTADLDAIVSWFRENNVEPRQLTYYVDSPEQGKRACAIGALTVMTHPEVLTQDEDGISVLGRTCYDVLEADGYCHEYLVGLEVGFMEGPLRHRDPQAVKDGLDLWNRLHEGEAEGDEG